ncbi:TPA: hypothetical protein HNC40_26200 [Escherichia coli]|nr:hypothetical protein [Escherichia coli]
MFVIPVPLKRNTPFRRSWWTHSHIRKIAFRRGDRNPYPPLLMGPPATSNFYTREKYFMLVGMMPIWGFP